MPSLPENSPLWLTVVVLVFMGAMVFLQTRSTNSLHSADATEKIGGAYSQLLENMRKQIADLEADVAYLKVQLRKYTNWSAQLMKQLIDHGIAPVEPPDTGELKPR